MDNGQDQEDGRSAQQQQDGPPTREVTPEEHSQGSYTQVQIETYDGETTLKEAVVQCNLGQCRMTRACVEELGFSMRTSAGTPRKRIKLLMGVPDGVNCFQQWFKVAPERHHILLTKAVSDRLKRPSKRGSYPVFAAPGTRVSHVGVLGVGGKATLILAVSEQVRKKRNQDRRDRLAREKQVLKEKRDNAMPKERTVKPTPAAVAQQ